MRGAFTFIVLCCGFTGGQSIAPASPRDPVAAVVDAFRTHEVVALGEGDHGNDQGHAFRVALVNDTAFRAAVNDIVVEFGSARHQQIVDRYVSGEAVPYSALRLFWEEAT